jgi:hypothetical protein
MAAALDGIRALPALLTEVRLESVQKASPTWPDLKRKP